MSGRRGPVGLGYMPKGGRPAAQRHNEALEARAAKSPSPSAAEPVTADERTDGRASGRPVGRRTERLVVVGLSAVTACVTSGLVEAVSHALGR